MRFRYTGLSRFWSSIRVLVPNHFAITDARRCSARAAGIPNEQRRTCGMTERPWILAESTWKTVDATPYDVAVLPWGATEAHNYHLPYASASHWMVSVA